MSTEIYYFSGTGNSLYVAKSLRDEIGNTKLIPMVSLLEKENIKSCAQTVGFVFPVYLSSVPKPVKLFLKKLDIGSATYIFSVATRLGTFHSADVYVEKAVEKKGKYLDSFFIVNMPNNSPCGLVPKSFPGFKKRVENWTSEIKKEKILQQEPRVLEQLSFITEQVLGKGKHKDERSRFQSAYKHLLYFLTPLAERLGDKETIPFYTDTSCTACGMCKEVCPSGKIAMEQTKPEWRAEIDCYFCFACFNLCPQQSVLIKDRYELKEGRYLYPGVEPHEIVQQKTGGFF